MPDREKVIRKLESQLDDLQKYADADEMLTLTQEQAKEILALLKEQKERIKKRDESLEKAYEEIKWLRGMLKEQEEEAQAIPQPHPCKECNKYVCDVHCPFYGK